MSIVAFPAKNLPLPEVPFMGLVARAFESREKARSYRNFRVGASGWARDCVGNPYVVEGHNFKLESGEYSPKDCAEMKIMRASLMAGVSLEVLVVIGEPQRDHGSGLLNPTLHPCEECRRMMRLWRGQVVTDETQIITVHPIQFFCQLFTPAKLMATHGEQW